MARPKTPAKKKAEKILPPVTSTQSWPRDIYDRIIAFQKAKKFSTEQEVVRIGIHDFLERQGF
jgi:hypothetical protein